MSFHSIYFHGEIRKIIHDIVCRYSLISGAVVNPSHAEYLKMPCPPLIFSQSDYLSSIVAINSQTKWQTVQIQISWLLLDLHCLQRQGISGLSRTRVKVYDILSRWLKPQVRPYPAKHMRDILEYGPLFNCLLQKVKAKCPIPGYIVKHTPLFIRLVSRGEMTEFMSVFFDEILYRVHRPTWQSIWIIS